MNLEELKAENRKMREIIKAMAEELAILRRESDYEEGRYNAKDYNVENIIKNYEKDFENF